MHDSHDDTAAIGHNQPLAAVAQWQTPHLPADKTQPVSGRAGPADFDLVEQSFIEGFRTTSDPTSFLRLAGVPFKATDDAGRTLCLLRVQLDQTTDVGSITPHLGGQSYRYDPLPKGLISTRTQLHFIYHDGDTLREFSFDQAKQLEAQP
ncbi:MAG: hypothetical protein R3F54_03180 [Alphaproteobacteria bacterium]